jgi:hypothetical protein
MTELRVPILRRRRYAAEEFIKMVARGSCSVIPAKAGIQAGWMVANTRASHYSPRTTGIAAN